jgi:hypothetical protein
MGEAKRRAFREEAASPFVQNKKLPASLGQYVHTPQPALASNVQVLIPSGRGFWPIEFCISLLSASTFLMQHVPKPPMGFNVEVSQSSTLQENRERLIKKALSNGATHLILLDDDHAFPPDTFRWMLDRDQDVLTTNYVRRTVPTYPVARGLDKQLLYTRHESTGLEEVMYSGLGVACIKASVFDNLPEPWFDFVWEEHPKHPGQWVIGMSEDVYFMNKLRAAGYKVMVDHDLSKQIQHIGQFSYTWQHALPPEEQLAAIRDGGQQ